MNEITYRAAKEGRREEAGTGQGERGGTARAVEAVDVATP